MNEQKMTIGDAMRMAISKLEEINIPVSLIQQIGLPVAQSINILRDIYLAMEENERKKQEQEDNIERKQQEQEDNIQLEVVQDPVPEENPAE